MHPMYCGSLSPRHGASSGCGSRRRHLKVRIYKTVILPVVLYGCETWTLTFREEERLRVFENKILRKIFGAKRDEVTGDENKILRKIFGAKRDEVTGEQRKLHNTELHALYSSPDIIRNIKSRRLRWAGHVARMGESRNAYSVLIGRPEGKRPLGRPRRRWEDNIKMDLREVGYDDREWINFAQDRDQWRACEGGNELPGSLKASKTHFDIERHARIPTWNTILRWVASFRTTGSTLKKKSPGRTRSASTPANVETDSRLSGRLNDQPANMLLHCDCPSLRLRTMALPPPPLSLLPVLPLSQNSTHRLLSLACAFNYFVVYYEQDDEKQGIRPLFSPLPPPQARFPPLPLAVTCKRSKLRTNRAARIARHRSFIKQKWFRIVRSFCKTLANQVTRNPSVALYGAETWTLRRSEEKRIEAFEMWIWRRLERVTWRDRVRNEAVLERVDGERMMLKLIRKRKRN
ncbi:hypothetical protein ANN_14609 [Periplaneta americana]|uniref:Uncharacterized protein n=1 Tax=Periplaneta americana TaxID=6978 RepID=A0ABQ8SYC7_PERAM|nr:hypothetical protein ANN_14609 [Periplaneta americana]